MILVVDDMQEIIEWLVVAVRDSGYHADWAMDANAALYKLERIAYAMAIIDIRLPGPRTGNDVARAVKAMPEPFRNVPLVAMTGSRLTADDNLFDAVLTKPFLPRDLRAVIAAHALPPIEVLHPAAADRE